MGKRQSETGQIRKEELEALNDRDESNNAPFQRASVGTMQGRRIISAIKPPRAAMKSTSSNPFSNTVLQSAPTKNMFAVPNNSFIPTATVRSNKATAFPMKIGVNKNVKLNEAQKLNLALVGFTQFGWNKLHALDWSSWLEKYANEMDTLKKGDVHDDDEDGIINAEGQSGDNQTMETEKDVNREEQTGDKPSSGQTSSAPAPTSTPASNLTFGISSNVPPAIAPAPKFTGFSFGGYGAGSVANAPAPAPSVPPPVMPFSNTPAVPINSKEEDNAKIENEPTKVLPATNEDEESLHVCRAKYRKFMKEEKEWKSFSAGALSLFRHKVKGSCRMILRNEYGSVKLNLAVCKGMCFKKKAGQKIGSIQFVGVQDSNIGHETFMLVVRPTELNKLHETLEEMAK